MSESQDYEKYLKGEIRVDGWKSEWRRTQEAFRGNQVFRAAPVAVEVASKPRTRTITKPQYNKQYMRERRAEAIKNGNCSDCYRVKARKGKTTCQPCQDKRNARTLKRYYAKKAA